MLLINLFKIMISQAIQFLVGLASSVTYKRQCLFTFFQHVVIHSVRQKNLTLLSHTEETDITHR